MASKSAQDGSVTSENIEEMLDVVDKALDRVKTLYEQYFLGIQKQPPTFLHTDIERKLRDLTQLNVRNTGLRYRLATINQKFGSYNSYWRRTLRQIENGTYLRNLSKIGREAIRSGAEIPEEILAAMPKRMREQVVRDREAAIAIARRRNLGEAVPEEELLTLADELQPPDAGEVAAMISEPSQLRRDLKTRGGAHILDEADGDLDLSAFFAEVDALDSESAKPAPPRPAAPAPAPAAPASTRTTGPVPAMGPLPTRQTGPVPAVTPPKPPNPPNPPAQAAPARPASSQNTRPIPIVPGAAAARGPVEVESMAGPFPRAQTNPPASPTPAAPGGPPRVPAVPTKVPPVPPVARAPVPGAPQRPMPPAAAATKPAAAPPPPSRPPPGMTDADVNALYAKYVQAKQLVGEATGPKEREKLMKTINAQAPKIMEQYKAKGVDFSVVVKDNQVIIRAKPKG